MFSVEMFGVYIISFKFYHDLINSFLNNKNLIDIKRYLDVVDTDLFDFNFIE